MRKFLEVRQFRGQNLATAGGRLPVIGISEIDSLASILSQPDCGKIVLSDCRGGVDLQRCDIALSVAEARLGLPEGETGIIASACDTAAGYLALGTFAGKSLRLAGLTWNRTDFSVNLRCDVQSEMAELARMQLVIAARAADVDVFDSLPAREAASEEFVRRSRSLGFDGVSIPV